MEGSCVISYVMDSKLSLDGCYFQFTPRKRVTRQNKMDVRQLFNAYKLQRKRKLSESEPEVKKREEPCYVSHHLTETALLCPLDETVQVAKETDEVIQLKVKYHVKRMRLSTRQLLSASHSEK